MLAEYWRSASKKHSQAIVKTIDDAPSVDMVDPWERLSKACARAKSVLRLQGSSSFTDPVASRGGRPVAEATADGEIPPAAIVVLQEVEDAVLEVDRIADQELDSPRPNRASNSDGVAMRKVKQGKVVSRQARKRAPVASPVTETSVAVHGAPRAQLLICYIAPNACVVVRFQCSSVSERVVAIVHVQVSASAAAMARTISVICGTCSAAVTSCTSQKSAASTCHRHMREQRGFHVSAPYA